MHRSNNNNNNVNNRYCDCSCCCPKQKQQTQKALTALPAFPACALTGSLALSLTIARSALVVTPAPVYSCTRFFFLYFSTHPFCTQSNTKFNMQKKLKKKDINTFVCIHFSPAYHSDFLSLLFIWNARKLNRNKIFATRSLAMHNSRPHSTSC